MKAASIARGQSRPRHDAATKRRTPRLDRRGATLRHTARAGLLALLCCGTLAACRSTPPQPTADLVVIDVLAPHATLRRALHEAIANAGLSAPEVSHFGAMLARTAADLGHPADLYAEAEIFSFCSAAVAARVAATAREGIALCPLSIALYSLPDTPRRSRLAYRPSPDAGANALLERLAADAAGSID
jgi:hypothetical protein